MILAVVALTVSARNEWQKLDTVPAASLLFLALSAIATGLSWLCYYRALQLGPVSKVAPVDKLSVAFAMVLGAVILGESMSWKVLLGGALIVGGSLLMLLS
ncbi:MAG TPA: EamA family transporter [Burkholderiales bacterium]|nr:EamA family transporter [Burkholderiales bacterium]